jgi:hypothetical protein
VVHLRHRRRSDARPATHRRRHHRRRAYRLVERFEQAGRQLEPDAAGERTDRVSIVTPIRPARAATRELSRASWRAPFKSKAYNWKFWQPRCRVRKPTCTLSSVRFPRIADISSGGRQGRPVPLIRNTRWRAPITDAEQKASRVRICSLVTLRTGELR